MKARQARHLGLETKSTGNKRPKRKQTEHRVLKFEQEQGADTKDYYSYSTKGCGAKIGKKVWYEELLLIRTAERRGYEVLLLFRTAKTVGRDGANYYYYYYSIDKWGYGR